MNAISDIKKRNQEVGHHFFDPATMRFFDSKVYDKVFGDYFVTSEQAPAGLRRYSVRKVNWVTGEVVTVGQFQEFESLREAYRAAERYANDDTPTSVEA